MIDDVRARIAAACARVGRSEDDVTLVAVTKGRTVDEIRARVLDRGHRVLGESFVQEWRDKREALPEDVEWHFVGNLQRNKVKYLGDVEVVHSLNSRRLADTMQKQGSKRGFALRAMIEVNIAEEDSKHGVAPGRVRTLVDHCRELEHVHVEGLMAMAPFSDDPENARPWFAKLRELRDSLGLVELSMGMSGDYEVAIEEGATIVRVGSAIFEDGAQ